MSNSDVANQISRIPFHSPITCITLDVECRMLGSGTKIGCVWKHVKNTFEHFMFKTQRGGRRREPRDQMRRNLRLQKQ